MDLTLLSGVVRNRRMAGTVITRPAESRNNDGNEAINDRFPNNPVAARLFHLFERNNICKRFSLRVHKFSFQWDLVIHFAICILSLVPFSLTGERLYSFLPLSVWLFYHLLFIIYPRQANLVIPGFGRFKHSFKATIEDFFSPKLLPVLSFSFLLVTLSLAVTGHRLGGPPLCFQPCGDCLAQWKNAVELGHEEGVIYESYRNGCGYANGKEMLAFYTMAQTSFLLFVVVVVAMSVCLAWRIAEEEHEERSQAEAWLKRESPHAFELRTTLIKEYGSPASSIRPEGSATWIFFGIIAALTFTLLGWHHWYVLPPSHTASLLIILNLLTILMTTLILHLGFFGRILALYKRNYLRVQCLTSFLLNMKETEIDHWWNCRNFVLNDDLSLDYDIGGLAVSMTFLMNVFLFLILLRQIYKEGGHLAMLEPPGSYCAYACLYITNCLIKIFTLATNTFEEQHHHIIKLQQLSTNLAHRSQSLMTGEYSPGGGGGTYHHSQSVTAQGLMISQNWVEHNASYDDYGNGDDGPIFIDGVDVESNGGGGGDGAVGMSLLSPISSPRGNFGVKSSRNLLSAASATALHANNHSISAVSPRVTGTKRHQQHKSSVTPLPPSTTSTPGLNVNANHLDFHAIVSQNLTSLSNNLPSNAHPSLSNFYFSPAIANSVDSHSPVEPYDPNYDNNEAFQPLLGNSLHNHPDGIRASRDDGGNDHSNGGLKRSGLSVVNPIEISRYSNTNNNNLGAGSNDTSDDSNSPHQRALSVKSFPLLSNPVNVDITSNANNNSIGGGLSIPKPVASRQVSVNLENYRQTIAEIISQIRRYDPYPCILGIPVMPALFNGSKFYIFISFVLIGVRTMISCFRHMIV